MIQEIAAILKQLNATEGIKGSLIITPDGMPVASLLEGGQDMDTVAAISSSIYLSITKSMEKLAIGDVNRYLLCTEFARFFIIGLGKMILIVLAAHNIQIAKVNVAIFQAANAIKKSGRLDV
ncbi:MAG: roadblock/LC7 domain-containing protein [Nitrospinae bacterium]|nr:roadblock/LC7 domain-containing protein [Nitrospinota bacterium]